MTVLKKIINMTQYSFGFIGASGLLVASTDLKDPSIIFETIDAVTNSINIEIGALMI